MKTEKGEQFRNEAEEEVDEGKKEAALEARKILGLKSEAGLADIKRVYRALALKFHPNKMPDVDSAKANQIMARLNTLYEILCDDIELQQNQAEDERKDSEEDPDLVALGDVFLDTLQLDVDPNILKAIQAYQGKWMEQEEEKGGEVDITVEGVGKEDDEEKEKGGKLDIKA